MGRRARHEDREAHPLDAILGTVASVRVLRALADGVEQAPPFLAARTALSRPAVRDALLRLEQGRIVERVGQGRNVLYRLTPNHPLTRRIVKLFRAEARRVAAVLPFLLAAGTALR